MSTIAAQQEAAVARGDFAEAARLKPLVAKLQALEGYKHAAVSAHFYEEAAEWQASLGAWAARDDAARWAAADAAHDAARRGRAVAAGLGGGGATGAIVQLDGATGPMAHVLNGTYDLWEASDDGSPAFVAPAFLKRGSFRRGGKPGARAVWLYLATNKRGAKLWFVSNTKHKDARKNIGFAYNSVPINTAASAVGGAPPLPHQSALGCWKVAVGGGKQGYAVQPPIAIRSVARAEADQAEAGAAAAWDAAAARGGDAAPSVTIAGAAGDGATYVNGTFDRVPGERAPGGAPVYKHTTQASWLFFASVHHRWSVGRRKRKDARKAGGWASSAGDVTDGTLPHEARAGGWQVYVYGKHAPQPAVTVTRHG